MRHSIQGPDADCCPPSGPSGAPDGLHLPWQVEGVNQVSGILGGWFWGLFDLRSSLRSMDQNDGRAASDSAGPWRGGGRGNSVPCGWRGGADTGRVHTARMCLPPGPITAESAWPRTRMDPPDSVPEPSGV